MKFLLLRNKTTVIFMTSILGMANIAWAVPFMIAPKTGTTLPTQISVGQTLAATYTITNNTASLRNNNFIKHLPPNVAQIISDNNIPDLCAATFNLFPRGSSGDSCTLKLGITGAVSSSDSNANNHLFACFPGGKTCAGTAFPLNVIVSNSSTPAFVAGGSYIDNNLNYFIALAISNNGTSWSQQALQPPTGFQQGVLNDVSCAGATCNGVDVYEDVSSNQYAAIAISTDSGNTWNQQVLLPPAGYQYGSLSSVFCNTQNCVAAGQYSNITTGDNLAAVALSNNSGTTWTQQILPFPSGMVDGFMNGIFCQGNNCVGVGGYSNGSFTQFSATMLSNDGGNTWSQQVLSLPAGISYASLSRVSCANGTCIGVGDYFDNSGNDNIGLAISNNNGSTWNETILTPPGGFTHGFFVGINCTTNFCVAVGSYSFGVNYTGYPAIAVTRNNGSTWSQQNLPIPSGFTYGYLNGVNCNGNVCVAVGYFQTISSITTPFVAYSSDSGNTWSEQVLTPPTPYTQGQFNGVG